MALVFNAAADALYLGGGTQPTDNTVWTVCLWVRTHSTQDPSILVENDAGGSDICLALDAGVPGILNGYGFTWPAHVGSALTDNVWYFLAIRCNGTAGAISRGTESVACTHATGTIPAQGSAYRIWIGGTTASFFPTADLALARAWNANLSDAEIEAERQSATPVRTTSLFGDWPLASDATKLTNNSGGGNLTANGAGPWSDVTGPSFGSTASGAGSSAGVGAATGVGASVVNAVASAAGTGAAAATAVVGPSTAASAGTSTVSGVGRALFSAVGSAAGVGAANANSPVVQPALNFSVPMPLVSRPSKPVFGTGTPAQMVDGKYGYVDGVAEGAWACAGGSWVAVQVGAGPTSVLVALSNDNASGGSYLSSVIEAYRIQVSSNSTNGSDGTWTTAVTVTGNPAYAREHLVAFTGYSWVKLLVDTCTGAQLDELNVWDASAGAPDTFAFLGDSITDGALRRHFYTGGGLLPSFQENVQTNNGHYPLQLNVGVTGQNAAYWAANIASALSLYPDVKYWCVGIGMNDGASMPSQLTAWRTDMTTVLNAITAAGRVPILARTTYTGATGYGGGDYATCGLRYLNDNGVDYLANLLSVRRGPDLFASFYANASTYAVTSDPHPNETGYKAWTRAWADSLGVGYFASASGTSTAAATGVTVASGVGTAAGVGAASATGQSLAPAVGTASGVGAAAASSSSVSPAVGASSGVGSATAVGGALAASVAASSGTGAASGVGAELAAGVGATSGTGAAAATGLALFAGVGSASGVGAASAQGTVEGAGSISTAAGVSSVAGVGASLVAAVGAATGAGAAASVSNTLALGAGSTAGSSAAAATGLALFGAVASASGVGAAAGVGTSTGTSSAGASAGVSSVSGVGASTAAAVGSTAGTSTVAGYAPSLVDRYAHPGTTAVVTLLTGAASAS